MQRLSTEIRVVQYHSLEIIRDPSGVDLKEALAFQKSYAQVICNALEDRLENSGGTLNYTLCEHVR